MSRPMNMLRTRRKDCNVKPNRRLDRKSSRGMLYENEELRLKTININAEVESRQSDIKKLKRENEMLKKGLWYLRDEYDKLEKLIKDKKIDFSSSSTTCSSSSDLESCTSCSEESEEVETTQNIKNVQKTNLKNMQDQFDLLSVVTEETSADNSEINSIRTSLPNETWNSYGSNTIKPDQCYPDFKNLTKSQTLPIQEKSPMHFFSPIQPSKSFDDNHFNQMHDTLYPGEFYGGQFGSSMGNLVESRIENQESVEYSNIQHNPSCENFLSQQIVQTNASSFFQNMVLVPKSTKPQPEAKSIEKSSTDLIVKIDNKNFDNSSMVFSNTPSQTTFSNGGNLEELLNDIESISQRGVQHNLSNGDVYYQDGTEFIDDVQKDDTTYMKNQKMNPSVKENEHGVKEKPYKSELNVVLMPNPMPLIGFDKYSNIKRSLENVNSRSIEELSASQQDLCVISPPAPPPPLASVDTPKVRHPLTGENTNMKSPSLESETNPFFFGHMKDNYVNSDYFNIRYNPNKFLIKEDNQKKDTGKPDTKSGSKTNLLDLTSSEQVSSENEENLKFKTSKPDEINIQNQLKTDQSEPDPKLPKLSIRKKVSIHFKGKKDKNKKLSITIPEPAIPKTPNEKKTPLFDMRFNEKDREKNKNSPPQTQSLESRKSMTEAVQEPKTPTTADSKTSTEKRNPSMTNDKREMLSEKKLRKSVSISPDRNKHFHGKEEGSGKKHKKHKKSEKNKIHRPSLLIEPRTFRERSFSVCTDRSNVLEHRLGLGLGFGSSLYFEEFSDREMTNSASSSDTVENARKMSNLTNLPLSGKVPWCGCWGNGCL